MSNISITKNYMGFAAAWGFYPGSTAGVTETGNVTFDYSNPAYAANAWAAYQAAGLPTKNVLVSTGGSTINASSETGSTTLYGSAVAHMYGGIGQNNFVPNGRNYIFAGGGANIFTYLSPTGDTAQSGIAAINGFDPAKDVIDLSHIDADLTAAGQQNFTFIGTNAFTGAGAQVNYQYDPSDNLTTVEATLAGDATPDWETTLTGQVTLTAANFALTPAQSTTDLADGAALSITAVRSGNAEEYNYSNVQGRSYSSYSSVDWNNGVAADDLNLSAASNEVDLFESGATITRGASAESFAIGAAPIGGSFALGYHTNETINASNAGAGAETFHFSAGFGNETIDGFAASGTNADTLVLSTAAFSYLNAGMTQAQDLAAVLSATRSGPNGAIIANSHGDTLTLAGFTPAMLAAAPGAVKFV